MLLAKRRRRSLSRIVGMLDLGYVRANLDEVRRRLSTRGLGVGALLNDFSIVDQQRRDAITGLERLQADRNVRSAEIGQKKKHGEYVEIELGNL